MNAEVISRISGGLCYSILVVHCSSPSRSWVLNPPLTFAHVLVHIGSFCFAQVVFAFSWSPLSLLYQVSYFEVVFAVVVVFYRHYTSPIWSIFSHCKVKSFSSRFHCLSKLVYLPALQGQVGSVSLPLLGQIRLFFASQGWFVFVLFPLFDVFVSFSLPVQFGLQNLVWSR